jgi:hypothetical protein
VFGQKRRSCTTTTTTTTATTTTRREKGMLMYDLKESYHIQLKSFNRYSYNCSFKIKLKKIVLKKKEILGSWQQILLQKFNLKKVPLTCIFLDNNHLLLSTRKKLHFSFKIHNLRDISLILKK